MHHPAGAAERGSRPGSGDLCQPPAAILQMVLSGHRGARHGALTCFES